MRLRRTRSAAGLLCAALAAALALAAVPGRATAGTSAADTTSATSTTTVVSVTFGGSSGTIRSPYVAGSAHDSIRSDVLTRSGGVATAVTGFAGSAMRLPTYQPLVYSRDSGSTTATPLAVLRLTDVAPPSSGDPLDPGLGTFSWGADFSVDNDTGDDLADGDNVFQRGLTPNTLWKLQADHHLVTCGLKTLAMSDAIYTSGFSIPADEDETSVESRTFYRARCTRTTNAKGGATLTATLKRRTSSGSWTAVGPTQTASGSAAGKVSMDWSIPLSVGGKLSTTGSGINEHPDEFNGIIDNVLLTFG